MADAPYLPGADLFSTWQNAVFDDTPSPSWKVGAAFDPADVGPGRIVLIGGAPAAGKTCLIMQMVFDALFLDPALRVVVANVEMSPARLLDRQLSLLAGVPLTAIRRRQIVLDDYGKLGNAMT